MIYSISEMEVMQTASKIYVCVCSALITYLPRAFEAALNQCITKAACKQDSKNFYVRNILGLHSISLFFNFLI